MGRASGAEPFRSAGLPSSPAARIGARLSVMEECHATRRAQGPRGPRSIHVPGPPTQLRHVRANWPAAGPLAFLPPPYSLSPAACVPLCSAHAAGPSPQSLPHRPLEARAGVGRKGGRGLAGLPGPYILNRELCVAATVRLCNAGLQPSAAAGSESRRESRFPTAQSLRMRNLSESSQARPLLRRRRRFGSPGPMASQRM
jgi:hypothetical protein